MALSPDGEMLFVVNTPDHRVEIFAVDDSGSLGHAASVPVGTEPVACAVPTSACLPAAVSGACSAVTSTTK